MELHDFLTLTRTHYHTCVRVIVNTPAPAHWSTRFWIYIITPADRHKKRAISPESSCFKQLYAMNAFDVTVSNLCT